MGLGSGVRARLLLVRGVGAVDDDPRGGGARLDRRGVRLLPQPEGLPLRIGLVGGRVRVKVRVRVGVRVRVKVEARGGVRGRVRVRACTARWRTRATFKGGRARPRGSEETYTCVARLRSVSSIDACRNSGPRSRPLPPFPPPAVPAVPAARASSGKPRSGEPRSPLARSPLATTAAQARTAAVVRVRVKVRVKGER